jgi:hypothetical protein
MGLDRDQPAFGQFAQVGAGERTRHVGAASEGRGRGHAAVQEGQQDRRPGPVGQERADSREIRVTGHFGVLF